jgi:hypothetical protein
VINLADVSAEDDRAYHAAWVRLRKTLIDTGWTPPPLSGTARDPGALDGDDHAVAEHASNQEAGAEAQPG